MARQLHCHSELGRFAPFHAAFGAFFWWGRLAIHKNRHLTFAANCLLSSRAQTLILLS